MTDAELDDLAHTSAEHALTDAEVLRLIRAVREERQRADDISNVIERHQDRTRAAEQRVQRLEAALREALEHHLVCPCSGVSWTGRAHRLLNSISANGLEPKP